MQDKQFEFDEAEEQAQKTSTEDRVYRREFAKIQIKPKKGKEKAVAGQGVAYGPVVITAITMAPPFKNSRAKNYLGDPLPTHSLEFFDPDTGQEFKLTLDSVAKKKYENDRPMINRETGSPVYDGIKRNFPGGILYAMGTGIDEDEAMDIIDRDSGFEDRFDWDPTEYDWEAVGGMYKLNPKFFGKAITIYRKAISLSRSGTLQVFEYEEVPTDQFPRYDEFMARYDEFGNFVDTKPAPKEKSSPRGATAVSEDMIKMAEELIVDGVPKADAILELKGLAECSKKAATEAVETAMNRLEAEAKHEAEEEAAANDADPSGDPDDAWMTENNVPAEQFNTMKEAYENGDVKPLTLAKMLREKFKLDRSAASGIAKSFVAYMKVPQE